jgi:hypothetical protein
MTDIPNPDQDLGGYHPLFLPEDGASAEDFPPKPIRMIQVFRLEAGQQIKMPETYNGDDPTMRTDGDLFRIYGGGSYMLVARDFDGQIYAKRRYHFAGPPRGATTTPPGAPGAPAGPAAVDLSGLGPGGGLVGLFVNMMQANQTMMMTLMSQAGQSQRESLMAMMQAQAQASAQTTQILIAALSGTQQAAGSGNAAMTTLVSKMLERAPSGSPEDMVKALGSFADLAKKMNPGASEGELSQILQGLGAFFGTMQAAKQMAPPQQGGPPVVVEQQPPNGTNGAPIQG